MSTAKQFEPVKTESLHFIVSGRWLTDMVQNLALEPNLKLANRLLDNLRPIPTFSERKLLFTGEGQFFGNSLCKDPECSQCKELRNDGEFRFENIPDEEFREKIIQRKKYLKEYFFDIDESTVMSKRLVAHLMVKKYTLEQIKKVRYSKDDSDRLDDKKLNKDYLKALDEWEFALDALYQEFQIQRGKDYPIGTMEWKNKIEVEGMLDIVKAQAVYNDEIREIIRESLNTATITAMAVEKLYAVTRKGDEDYVMMEDLAENIKRKPPTKKTKETIKIGRWDVPKNVIEDYENAVSMSNTASMVYKAKYGKLDPEVEMKKLRGRIELHKAIFDSIGLPYHQDIKLHKKKLTKKEQDSLDFQRSLSNYLDGNLDDNE